MQTQPLSKEKPAEMQPLDLAALGQTWSPAEESAPIPEVSDVLVQLPWWAARGLLYVIVGFVLMGVLWASFCSFDVVVEAPGSLAPEGSTRPVQAVVGGRVEYVLVEEGATVERGQMLMQLDPAETRGRLDKLREELNTSQEQLRRLRALKGLNAETLEQENRISRLHGEINGAEFNLKNTTITAPHSGVITTLDVRGGGIVIQPGQELARMAPAGSRLVAEILVQNKDIALIEKGLPAHLKFEAFPVQDYGLTNGTVIEIAPDVQGGKDTGSTYRVVIGLDQNSLPSRSKAVRLRPGLTLTAEIVTERRTVLDLLTEPFRQFKGALDKNR